ncbi:MAG: hypothetical protein O7D86_10890 [Proteobacteria bacterium]|nr:hypothetical protein [Pseudomonadota bacterium]
MTRLGNPVPPMVEDMRRAVKECCDLYDYSVIDARARVTGRDFLLKIWKLIASAPLSVGILHEDIPESTQANIFYEIGVAQALGKETVIIKSPGSKMPSDFVRNEYIEFDDNFREQFNAFLSSIFEQADCYELLADQLEKNPILALDYLRRAYLIKGDGALIDKATRIVDGAGLEDRAANSVELLAASF